jgi:CelD/BcsL family acetyltransferase involved in cellulose biosynthesis
MITDMRDPSYHPNNFGVPLQQEFLRQLAMDLAPKGNFRMARLVVDDETVACRILLPANEHMFMYYSGFDPRWRKYNIMAQVTITWVKHAIAAHEFAYVNLSTNFDRSKERWRPEPGHLLANLEIASPTLRGRTIDAVRRSAAAVRKQAR